jgi:hypothetical protein
MEERPDDRNVDRAPPVLMRAFPNAEKYVMLTYA